MPPTKFNTLKNKSCFLFLIIFIISCDKKNIDIREPQVSNQDECELISDLGIVSPLEESKSFIPYPDNITKLILSDSLNQEIEGIVTFYDFSSDLTGSSTDETPCPIDSTILIEYHWETEQKTIVFEFEEIGLKLRLALRPVHSHNGYIQGLLADYCSILLFSGEDYKTINSQMSIIVNPRNHPMPNDSYSDFKEQLEIHNQIFNNVYINEIEYNDKFKILYNDEFGLLGLKNNEEPFIDLKFKRIE